ncbi:MAG TPA: polyprenyl synthetase family protein [bacterium]|nr:polyprenyl synthetase family protein [bacterium]HPP29997.1 polyprenyl synthetase family protein [bacterium]
MDSKEILLKKYREMIDGYLEKILPPEDKKPEILHKAMRYSVFSGGKRLRPLIVLITGDILGVEGKKLLPAACGIELIHNFSLIHDDLPAMDNDDFRRGKETCHKKFNEAVAILAGDALLTLGFKLIAETGNPLLVKATADAIGSEGMAGGQVIDMLYKDKKISLKEKNNMDYLKTGKLFQLCFSIPLYFIKVNKEKKEKILNIGRNFGRAFQIRDDIEDGEGDTDKLRSHLAILYKKMKKDVAFFGDKGVLLLYVVDKLYNDHYSNEI